MSDLEKCRAELCRIFGLPPGPLPPSPVFEYLRARDRAWQQVVAKALQTEVDAWMAEHAPGVESPVVLVADESADRGSK